MPQTEYRFRDMNSNLQRRLVLNTSNEIEIRDGSGNTLINLEKQFIDHLLIPDSSQTGLAADSTGVKWTSNFKFKINGKRAKSVVLRASWSASESDSVAAIELYDIDGGAVVGSLSGNAGTDEEENIDPSSVVSDHLYTMRLNITTASATSGATVDVSYIVVELIYR